MWILNFFIHVLTTMFLVGLIGSSFVVTIAFVQDIGVLFGRDSEDSEFPGTPGPTSPAPAITPRARASVVSS